MPKGSVSSPHGGKKMLLECPICGESIEVPTKEGKVMECPECESELEVVNVDGEWELVERGEEEEEWDEEEDL